MLGYTLRRLGETIPIWIVITLITFLLMNVIPGDPVMQLIDARSGAIDQQVVEQIREEWGLNDPLPVQYLHFMQGLVQGDLGLSFQTRSPVVDLILARLPVTIQLTALSLIIAVAAGIALGVVGALYRKTWIDSLVSSFSVAGASVPSFFLGLILMYLFAVRFKLLPASGYVGGDLKFMILPALTLGLAVSGVIARITRSSMVDILKMDYITTAYSKGLMRWKVILVHALKNALTPILTIIGVQLGLLLSGAVITETIFGLPGIGRLLIDSILKRDLPTVEGCIILIATIFLVVNLITDIICRWIDPRIRINA